MDTVECRAYGKINLSLDVTGRRADGYHLVRMVMQTVDVYDTVTMKRIPGSRDIAVETDSGDIPAGPENLVWRAARVMQDQFHLADGLKIRIEKRIPVAAGMAGGSADAAAVFRGLREMYGLDVSDERLRSLALPLGADIPYCINGGTQLAEGIGEELTVLPPAPQGSGRSLILVKPDLFVSTGWVYRSYDGIPAEEVRHPEVDAQVAAIRQGNLPAMAAACGNVLEQETGATYPVIGELEQFLLQQGAIQSIMTGSGPTVFALFDSEEAAAAAFEHLEAIETWKGYQKFQTEFWQPQQ